MPEKVTVEFELGEDVTPELFGRRVAQACSAYHALRPGEGVRVLGSDRLWKVPEPPGPGDTCDFAWPPGSEPCGTPYDEATGDFECEGEHK